MTIVGAAANTRTVLHRLLDNLPTGLVLPPRVWAYRHRVIRMLLLANAAGLTVFGLIRGYPLEHVALEISFLVIAAALAGVTAFSRSARAAVATLGLVTASALAVHLSGGTIEAHFHFFVMLGVISLYQHWMPLLLALGYVVVHHGLLGFLVPGSVYNHADALQHPWRWAMIHALFVLAASAVNVIAWRMNESTRAESALVLNSMREGIFGFDREGIVTFMNPAAATMIGLDPSDAEGRGVHDLLHRKSDHTAADCPLLLPVGAPGDTGEDTFTTGGDPLPVEFSRIDISARAGSQGTVVSFRDASGRLAAENELRNALSLLTATLEATADGILVVDRQGKIASANAQFGEMWRIPDDVLASGDDDQAIGFVLSQLKDPDGFVEKVRELYGRPAAESRDVLEFKDGRVFERYSKPQWVGGTPVGRVWSFRDVTERNRLDEMKNGFLSAVSHELRTPLAGVLGYAITLNRADIELTAPERRDIIERLESCARKLQRLLNDTIDLDRLSRGILAPLRAPTDIGILVRRVADDFEAGDHPIIIRAEGEANVDAAKVERMVENLLLNAVRHTANGTAIEVRTEQTREGIILAVEDSGPGVPDEQKVEIFQAFQRGAASTSHSPGFGIGLALVANFAELHGGRAWVEDRPGGGSSFRVLLPSAGPLDEPIQHLDPPVVV